MYSNFSKRAIKTINSLPVDDRQIVAAALLAEDFGAAIPSSLTPLQGLAYTIIRSYMKKQG